jgi:thiol-disulfide isomerase/thioredoxin
MKQFITSAFVLLFQFFSSLMNAQETIITGTLPVDFMEQDWALLWQKNEKEYVPNTGILESIKQSNLKDIQIEIVLGTWCEDSEKLIPQFIHINNEVKIPVVFIGVDKEKKCPLVDCSNWNIQYVPTFIIQRNGKEIGRIVEQVLLSIEADLLDIITNSN